jgi:hypothetical protein
VRFEQAVLDFKKMPVLEQRRETVRPHLLPSLNLLSVTPFVLSDDAVWLTRDAVRSSC